MPGFRTDLLHQARDQAAPVEPTVAVALAAASAPVLLPVASAHVAVERAPAVPLVLSVPMHRIYRGAAALPWARAALPASAAAVAGGRSPALAECRPPPRAQAVLHFPKSTTRRVK